MKPALSAARFAYAAMDVRDFFERPAYGHKVLVLDNLAGEHGPRQLTMREPARRLCRQGVGYLAVREIPGLFPGLCALIPGL
jgi:hypothetical protein